MKKRVIILSLEQEKELKKSYAETLSSCFRKRCQAVLLKSQGRTSKEVGKIVGLHQITVNNCLNRYEESGINGLKTKAGRGRKPILNVEQDRQLIKEIVCKERQRLKLAKIEIEQRLGKSLSVKTLKRFLKNLTVAGNG